MTWDQIIPEPVGSLAALLLLAGAVLFAAILTAIVLFGDRHYWLATGTYLLGLVTVFNGLVAYGYTPQQIIAQWKNGTFDAFVAATHLALLNYVVMIMFTILTLVLMTILFRVKHYSLGLLWLGAGMVEDYVSNTYSHYAVAAEALVGIEQPAHQTTTWATALWLSLAAASFVAAAALRLRGVLRKVAIRKYIAQLPFPVSSIPPTEPKPGPIIGDHMDFTVPPSQFLRQKFRASDGTYSDAVPYGIPRFRDQQRRWRRPRGKYLYAVFMYGMQFYGPPMPPDYRYYELHEFL